MEIYVNEKTEIGSVVGSIEGSATSRQASIFKHLRDSEESGNEDSTFYLDMLSGDIYSLKKLDSLVQSVYNMKVTYIN